MSNEVPGVDKTNAAGATTVRWHAKRAMTTSHPNPNARALTVSYVLTTAWVLLLAWGVGALSGGVRGVAVGTDLFAVGMLWATFYLDTESLLPRGARFGSTERRARRIMLVAMLVASCASIAVVGPRTSTATAIATVLAVAGTVMICGTVVLIIRVPGAAQDTTEL